MKEAILIKSVALLHFLMISIKYRISLADQVAWRNNSCFKECLIAFEYHSVLDDTVLVEVQPGAVSALTALVPIVEDPLATLVFDACLHL